MKDAKGHGSSSRGGSYHNIDKNLKGPGKHVGYANGPWSIVKRTNAGYQATHSSGASIRGDSLGDISERLALYAKNNPPASNAEAGSALAGGGAKSAAAPTHDAMHDQRVAAYENGLSPKDRAATQARFRGDFSGVGNPRK